MTSTAQAGHMLERARWAAAAYADYDADGGEQHRQRGGRRRLRRG